MLFRSIDQFAAEMDDFAACVRDGKPTRVPGEEGLRDVRIIDALYRSAATGRDVKLSPKQDGPPLNYFVYPYVEVDGKPYDKLDKQFSFEEVRASK